MSLRRWSFSLVSGVFLTLSTASCTRAPENGEPEPPSRQGASARDIESRGEIGGEYYARRTQMVKELATVIRDERVLDAMMRVPRHEFVSSRWRSGAYNSYTPIPIGEDQTISAPDVVAIMTEALELKGNERVLEIGTGSGYQAAILGELVPEVYTVEIRPALAEKARKRLADLKRRGILRRDTRIEVLTDDGYKGYVPKAPYDAIIVTAAPREVPVELLNQLKRGGRMVIPVGDFHQELQLIRRNADGALSEKKILPVRFVPMVTGKDAGLSG